MEGKEKGQGMKGISMRKEEGREPSKRAPNPFRVLNLSGKLGFLTRGITFIINLCATIASKMFKGLKRL